MNGRGKRFVEYLKHKGINDNQATIMCGLSKGLIGKAKAGKSDLGDAACRKVLERFTDLSKVWLLTGEGEMLRQPAPSAVNTNNATVHGNLTQNATAEAPAPPYRADDDTATALRIENSALQTEVRILRERLAIADERQRLLIDSLAGNARGKCNNLSDSQNPPQNPPHSPDGDDERQDATI